MWNRDRGTGVLSQIKQRQNKVDSRSYLLYFFMKNNIWKKEEFRKFCRIVYCREGPLCPSS
jgi:hypothetical protein